MSSERYIYLTKMHRIMILKMRNNYLTLCPTPALPSVLDFAMTCDGVSTMSDPRRLSSAAAPPRPSPHLLQRLSQLHKRLLRLPYDVLDVQRDGWL